MTLGASAVRNGTGNGVPRESRKHRDSRAAGLHAVPGGHPQSCCTNGTETTTRNTRTRPGGTHDAKKLLDDFYIELFYHVPSSQRSERQPSRAMRTHTCFQRSANFLKKHEHHRLMQAGPINEGFTEFSALREVTCFCWHVRALR